MADDRRIVKVHIISGSYIVILLGHIKRKKGVIRSDYTKGLYEGIIRRDYTKGLYEGIIRRDYKKAL